MPRPHYQPLYITPLSQDQDQNQDSQPEWPLPKLHLRVIDVESAGSTTFFTSVQPAPLLKDATLRVLKLLYPNPDTAPRSIRSVTLILKPMEGVAHTTSSDLDTDHKEIHFSTQYIQGLQHDHDESERARDEIYGVVVHEMVHCFQYDALGTCPGGLIEGIADYVRLKAGFVPPHWKRGPTGKKWDEGYQHTAYFLDWISNTHYPATPTPNQNQDKRSDSFVSRLNESMKDKSFSEDIFLELTGKRVRELWEEYSGLSEHVQAHSLHQGTGSVSVGSLDVAAAASQKEQTTESVSAS